MTEPLNDSILATVDAAIRRTVFLSDMPITAETRFSEDLALDSLDVVELTMALEELCELEFPHDTGRFRSVGDVVAFLSCRYFQDAPEARIAHAA